MKDLSDRAIGVIIVLLLAALGIAGAMDVSDHELVANKKAAQETQAAKGMEP